MKNPALFLLLLIGSTHPAAGQVEVRKYEVLGKFAGGQELEAVIKEKDTFYSFSFIDARYPSLRNPEVIMFSRAEVVKFINGLTDLCDPQYKADEASVSLAGGHMLMKRKMLGAAYIAVVKAGGAYTSLTNKQCLKLSDSIRAFFNQ